MSFNTSKGLSTGMQGAQLGGKVGGVYGAIGGGLLGLVLGGSDDSAEKAAKAYNDQVVKAAATDLMDMRRQQNIQNIRTSQALHSYQVNNKTQASTINANIGAADIIGSSAKALKQAMDFQSTQAQAAVMSNWSTSVDNYNRTIDTATNQRESQLKRTSGEQGADLGSLISGGMALWGEYGADIKGAFGGAESSSFLLSSPSINELSPVSLMSSMKETWEGGSGIGLGSSALFEPSKGYNDFDDVPVQLPSNITPIL